MRDQRFSCVVILFGFLLMGCSEQPSWGKADSVSLDDVVRASGLTAIATEHHRDVCIGLLGAETFSDLWVVSLTDVTHDRRSAVGIGVRADGSMSIGSVVKSSGGWLPAGWIEDGILQPAELCNSKQSRYQHVDAEVSQERLPERLFDALQLAVAGAFASDLLSENLDPALRSLLSSQRLPINARTLELLAALSVARSFLVLHRDRDSLDWERAVRSIRAQLFELAHDGESDVVVVALGGRWNRASCSGTLIDLPAGLRHELNLEAGERAVLSAAHCARLVGIGRRAVLYERLGGIAVDAEITAVHVDVDYRFSGAGNISKRQRATDLAIYVVRDADRARNAWELLPSGAALANHSAASSPRAPVTSSGMGRAQLNEALDAHWGTLISHVEASPVGFAGRGVYVHKQSLIDAPVCRGDSGGGVFSDGVLLGVLSGVHTKQLNDCALPGDAVVHAQISEALLQFIVWVPYEEL